MRMLINKNGRDGKIKYDKYEVLVDKDNINNMGILLEFYIDYEDGSFCYHYALFYPEKRLIGSGHNANAMNKYFKRASKEQADNYKANLL